MHNTEKVQPSVIMAWGSSTGYTEEVAIEIHSRLRHLVDAFVDIADVSVAELANFDVLILGVPTWHVGELQDDWEDCFDDLSQLDLRGKKVALFGCGDADGYPDTFQDAMGILWQQLEANGAELLGRWPIDSYEFVESRALTSDRRHFVGLAIDEHSQSELTDSRLDRWTAQLQEELAALPAEPLVAVAS